MKELGYEQLTLFQEDSLASLFLLPGNEQARKMTVTSGLKCYELYGKYSPLSSLVKMCLGSSIWHSTRCFLAWKKKDTPRKRLLFQLAVSTPRTDGTGSAFWPTPSTGAALCGGTGNFKTLMAMQESGIITEEERKQLSQGNGGKTNPGLLEWLMGYEQKFTELIPTPTATDYRGGCLTRYFLPKDCSQTVHVERERERERREQARIRRTSSELYRGISVWENWIPEPDVGRVAYGVPNRVDRIKCLGNAVVPQQFFPFFIAIAKNLMEDNQ